MRKSLERIAVVGLLAVVSTSAVEAELCTIDAVPAATLLLPYFEVDLNKKKGEDWVIAINNGSAAPTIAHVVIWTDMSVPTFDFDIFLTGFDTQLFSLKTLFRDGLVPAEEPFSGFQTLSELQAAHTGDGVDGNCYSTDTGRFARGYVTIDNVNFDGSLINPSDQGYFPDVANDLNQLWGQYYVTKGSFIQSDNLVHIEAGSNSSYTFYGRFDQFTGTDEREPLAEQWAARFINTQKASTELIVWRDSGVAQGPFTCNGLQGGWYPLGQTDILAFDEQENLVELTFDSASPPFPAETQRVRVGSSALPVPHDAGWLVLNLATSAGLQSYVIVQQDLKKRSSHHMAHPMLAGPNNPSSEPQVSSACGSAPNVAAGPVP